MAESLLFKPLGPMLPLAHLDPQASKQRAYEMDLREASRVEDLLAWLDSKPPRSVVYVAFGSIATLEEAKVVEIEAALRALGKPFIWVTGATDTVGGREAAAGDVGRIVGWCSQPEVLAHSAVGCFVTHCGWNSTLEGLTLGVPMVCMPWWGDQPTNAMFVEEVWGVGLRARAGDGGTVGRKEIARCVREVMAEGDEKGRQIWSRVQKWKDVIKTTVDRGGSSNRNLIDFVEMIRDKH